MFFPSRIVLLFTGFFIPFSSFTQTVENSIITETSRISGKTEAVSGIPEPTIYKPHLVSKLPSALRETSGLVFFDGQLYTINDSGNSPEIYQVDTTNGNVKRTIVIRDAVNSDWESITQDDASLYIGDFGNNYGNRTDLRILKIAKADLLNMANDTVKVGFIRFIYPDQAYFTSDINNHNFDCEAFFYQNNSLHLFSKNWSDLQTKHYILPVDTGNCTAKLAESFNADGLITDASINAHGNIVLLGYKNTRGRNYRCFAWLCSGYDGSEFFGGNNSRIELGSVLHLGQAEGIVLKDDNTGWLSSEGIFLKCIHKPAKLFSFDFGGFWGVGVERKE
jgi:hypothetical protein